VTDRRLNNWLQVYYYRTPLFLLAAFYTAQRRLLQH
jgi:hypothetical protein